jgi:hypothetical protein
MTDLKTIREFSHGNNVLLRLEWDAQKLHPGERKVLANSLERAATELRSINTENHE